VKQRASRQRQFGEQIGLPETRMVSGSAAPTAARNSVAVETVLVAPPLPPVVPPAVEA
jgi:hypothetical protein